MTLQQWENHPEFADELSALLRNQTLAAALQIVLEQALKPISPPPGVDIQAWGAMMGFKRDGYFEYAKNLRDLAIPPKPKAPEQKAWEGQTENKGAPQPPAK